MLAEIDRLGHVPRGKLIEVIALEGLATHYELRRAVDALVGSGRVEQREGVLSLAGRAERRRGHQPTTDASRARWQAQDDALEAYCQTMAVKDHEAPAHADVEPPRRSVTKTLAALAAIAPRQALVLRRFYGERDPSSRYDAFGEMAPLVEFTARIQAEQSRRIEAMVEARLERAMAQAGRMQRKWEASVESADTELERARKVNAMAKETGRDRPRALHGLGKAAQAAHNARASEPGVFDQLNCERAIRRGAEVEVTVASVLRELLDTPKKDGRTAFVREVETQAEQVLIEACAAYRGARRKG